MDQLAAIMRCYAIQLCFASCKVLNCSKWRVMQERMEINLTCFLGPANSIEAWDFGLT